METIGPSDQARGTAVRYLDLLKVFKGARPFMVLICIVTIVGTLSAILGNSGNLA